MRLMDSRFNTRRVEQRHGSSVSSEWNETDTAAMSRIFVFLRSLPGERPLQRRHGAKGCKTAERDSLSVVLSSPSMQYSASRVFRIASRRVELLRLCMTPGVRILGWSLRTPRRNVVAI